MLARTLVLVKSSESVANLMSNLPNRVCTPLQLLTELGGVVPGNPPVCRVNTGPSFNFSVLLLSSSISLEYVCKNLKLFQKLFIKKYKQK